MWRKIFLIGTLLLFFVACNQKQNKTGYVNITKIYNKIDLSDAYRDKILKVEQNIQAVLNAQEVKLDSIKNQLDLDKASQTDLKLVYKNQKKLDSLERYLSKALKDTTVFYNQKLEQKVNNWVYQFGKEHQYQFIFSPVNTNAFMYADSLLDVTAPVIEYINEKAQP